MRPEQERALAYVRAKGTEAAAAELRRRLAIHTREHADQVRRILARLTAAG